MLKKQVESFISFKQTEGMFSEIFQPCPDFVFVFFLNGIKISNQYFETLFKTSLIKNTIG